MLKSHNLDVTPELGIYFNEENNRNNKKFKIEENIAKMKRNHKKKLRQIIIQVHVLLTKIIYVARFKIK